MFNFFDPSVPFRPKRVPFYYGWLLLAAATLGIVMSLPGQTMGVSVFTGHLIEATGLSRLSLSNAYLAGTLISGSLLPWGGRLLDRFGSRRTVLSACWLLAAALCLLSFTPLLVRALRGHGAPTLFLPAIWVFITLGFVTLRFSGQGMLTLVSRTLIGRWFDRRRGLASGISGVAVSFGFSTAPAIFHILITSFGWQGAWRLLAALVGVAMALVGWAIFRDRPEDCDLLIDGQPRAQSAASITTESSDPDLHAALRSSGFWTVTLALGLQGLVITGITFHILDIAELARIPDGQALRLFWFTAAISIPTGFITGILADRFRIRYLLVAMLSAQVLGYFATTRLGQDYAYICAVVGLGFSGGSYSTLSTVALPRYFGRTHLGAIAGAQMMGLVIASALGPSIFAISRSWSGNYSYALIACALMPLPLIVFGLTSNPVERRIH